MLDRSDSDMPLDLLPEVKQLNVNNLHYIDLPAGDVEYAGHYHEITDVIDIVIAIEDDCMYFKVSRGS